MAWRLAKSLVTLRAEFDRLAPGRSKTSDGTIGDPAHAARASRHNPNRHGVVTALDITHDPAAGCDVHAIARAHVAAGPHPELAYIVSNGMIASRSRGWVWRTYTGSNPHTKHAHFAVGVGPDSAPEPPYDSTAPWGIATVLPLEEQTMKQGDNGPDVAAWQHRLKAHAGIDLAVDGDFGPATVAATKAWQKKVGIAETGTVTLMAVLTLSEQATDNVVTRHAKGPHGGDVDLSGYATVGHSHKGTVTVK